MRNVENLFLLAWMACLLHIETGYAEEISVASSLASTLILSTDLPKIDDHAKPSTPSAADVSSTVPILIPNSSPIGDTHGVSYLLPGNISTQANLPPSIDVPVSADTQPDETIVLPTYKVPPPAPLPLLGIGVTLIPAQNTWSLDGTKSIYQGGAHLDGFWQAYPWFRVGLSVGGSGDAHYAYLGLYYAEIIFSVETRFFLPRVYKTFREAKFLPYFVAAVPVTIGISSFPASSRIVGSEVYLGFHLGAGLEIRLSKFALTVDVRGVFRGGVRPANPDFLQAGLRVAVGLTYFFQGELK